MRSAFPCLECGGDLEASSDSISRDLYCISCGESYSICSECGNPIQSGHDHTQDMSFNYMKRSPVDPYSSNCEIC